MTRSAADREEMTRCCLCEVAQILQRPESVLDPTAKFTRLGLDSAMSVQLVVALEEKLGFELAPEIVFEHNTIARLSAYLCDLAGS